MPSSGSDRVVRNHHEWDDLREVVVGRWVRNTFTPPPVDSSMEALFPYITKDAWAYLGKAAGRTDRQRVE